MRRRSLLIATAILAACQTGGGSRTEPFADSEDLGTIVVTQDQIGCCYSEGQISFIRVTGNGVSTERWVGPGGERKVIARIDVRPGRYGVESWQRPCVESCPRLDENGAPIEGSGLLGPPTDQCTTVVDVIGGERLDALVEFAPREGCAIAAHTGGPPARIDGILDCIDGEIVYSEQGSLDPDAPGSHDPVDAMDFALSPWLGSADEPSIFGTKGTAVNDGREVARASVVEVPAGGWTVELLESCR